MKHVYCPETMYLQIFIQIGRHLPNCKTNSFK